MLGSTPLDTGTFVTVDIETTGSRPGTSGIIEIGAVRIEASRIVEEFSTLVRPHEPIPGVIRALTGIDDAMVAEAPEVDAAMRAFSEFAEGAVLIAHNHRFDLGFLDFEAERAGLKPFPRPILDTLVLSRKLHPELERHNLRTLAVYYDTPTTPNHRALSDAQCTSEVWLRMLPELAELGVSSASDVALYAGLAQQGTLARKLAIATHLPDLPGVYLFRDASGRVIHIGHARSIRTRARSYFYASGDPCPNNPAVEAASIQCLPCVSELDSMLLESRLLTRYAPPLNRHRQQLRTPHYIHLADGATPAIVVTKRRYRTGHNFGPVTNEQAARLAVSEIARAYGLRRCLRADSACQNGSCRSRLRNSCVGAQGGFASPDLVAELSGRSAGLISAVVEQPTQDPHAREVQRAITRTLAALDLARRCEQRPPLAVLEGNGQSLVAHIIIGGWLFTTVRADRASVADGTFAARVRSAATRALAPAVAGRPITARRLRDRSIIETYLRDADPLVIELGTTADQAAQALATAARRLMRLPRRSHAAVSAD